MIELILIFLILILLLHYIHFLLKIFFGLGKLNSNLNTTELSEFVSIIVPFRNEEKNIAKTYQNLIKQNYPADKYEILFINDLSEDNSLMILESQSLKNNVKVFTVPDDYSVSAHKKRAIRFGIEQSRGEIIVTTDADCTHPVSWLENLLKYFDENTAFVSGPVEFKSNSSLFSNMQRLEFAGLVIAGAGLIGGGSPTICNAANIAYRRKVFNEVDGFIYKMSLSSGDDELLMQKIHKNSKSKIKFAYDKKALVSTDANPTVSDFYAQRKRWASKGLFYQNKLLILKLILIFLFYLSLILQPVLGILISKIFFISFGISFLLKMLFEYLVIYKGSKKIFNLSILQPFLITELLQVPYIIVAGFMGMFGNLKWKNRKIKR
ncbi:MAG: glycosyltransferase [Ignavibacteriaceae bacterium]|jgi:cellulose synthase/poly-beta-1,6-N-acetylglucosamine synthase-like glycosyltransferase|nr:glycosyltransferase [Ignavibacteriaceae bacterium]